jgi:Domain of unknown function (DUF4331)
MKKLRTFPAALLAAAAVAVPGISAQASSHREAPNITRMPLVDGTDFYMFNSYESARSGFVTLIANYQPLQAPYGGPNYFTMDPNALYEIHIDNNGDAVEDMTFQFKFDNALIDDPTSGNAGAGLSLPIGTGGNQKSVAIPLAQFGAISGSDNSKLNVIEKYSVTVVRGGRRSTSRALVTNATAMQFVAAGSSTFVKPVDNIGTKSIPDYKTYADQHIYSVDIPGCSTPGSRLFVGQRKESFAVNLGTVFDLVHADPTFLTDPTKINAAATNNPGNISDGKYSVTTLALEVPASCLKSNPTTGDPVIGAWTTASVRQGSLVDPSPKPGHRTSLKQGGAWTQVSRLGNPLVNEVVIGLKDKDKFNASKPKDDAANFADYVTNPTLPALLGIALFNDATAIAPTNIPRTDLLNVFLTGIAGVNKPMGTVVPAETLRLNTDIPAVSRAQQNRLGVAGEVLKVGGVGNLGSAVDLAGFPNGRRPADDVVDIALVAVAGGLCVLNSNADLAALAPGDDDDVLGLNTFGTATSACNLDNVPLGATSANLHDGVDQAAVTFLGDEAGETGPRFPYLGTPTPGAM